MTTIHISGKPIKISTEEVRTMLHATKTVLEFHKLTPALPTVHVYIKPKTYKEFKKNVTGVAFYPESKIWLVDSNDFDDMLSTVIHEMIHVYHPVCGLQDDSEHQTSTLTAKLKPTVALIYETLSDGIYKRAGYIAHVQMAYKPRGNDSYNESENIPESVYNGAKKYRNKRKPFKPNRGLV